MMTKHRSENNTNRTNVREKKVGQKLFYYLLKMVWMVWPAIVENLILRLFFSPVEYQLNQSEKSLLARARSFHIKVNNKTIQCWQWGEGPVVIFAHGWNGRGVQFHPIIESLIKVNFSVVTFDAPGHGSSDGKTSNYFEFTDTLRVLWDSLKNENVVAVIGHSLGASAVINFVDKEKFEKKVVLIAPVLKLRELLFQTFAQHSVPKIVYQNLVQNFELVHGYNLFSDNPIQLIKNIKNNIMIFHDKSDKAVPYEDTHHAAELSDNIILHTSVGLGHNRILNDKSTIEKILTHLEKRKNANYSPIEISSDNSLISSS
jgi:pimeloyl-ACP methyl ester carboxylesterase